MTISTSVMKTALVCIGVTAFLCARSQAQLLRNGGFEEATLAPWDASGDVTATSGSVAAKEGAKYAVLAFKDAFFTASSLSFSQEITLPTAGRVSLEFFAQRFDSISGQDDVSLTFEARIDSTVLSTTLPTFAGSQVEASSWLRYRILTPASLPAGTHTVTFTFTRDASLFGRNPSLALDAVSLAVLSPIVIFEGFDIPADQPLSGTGGATSTGWNGTWTHPNNSGASGNVTSGSLERPLGTETFVVEPIGNKAFLSGLQQNSRVSPDNLSSRAPSIRASFLAQPTVGFNAGFSINFEMGGGFSNNLGTSVLFSNVSQTTTEAGNGRWQVSNGFTHFDTGNSFLDGVEAVTFELTYDVDGTKDLLRVWFDADPATAPPTFSTQTLDFGFPTPRFTVTVASSNNFNGSSLGFDELRVEAFQDVVITAAQLLNISTRLRVQTGENVLIGGFIITGTDPKKVLIRGIGPSLAQFFPGALADPTLELFQGSTSLQSNDNWKQSQQAEIEATGIPPTNELESAILRTLAPGGYTAIVRGQGAATGIGVVEAYDLDLAANSKLANISTRGFVETGDNVMIGGLIVGPETRANTRVVVRAIGPTLSGFGIAGALQDPALELRDIDGVLVRSNNDWKDDQQAEIAGTGLDPKDDRESALVETLVPGNYTAIVRGSEDTTGVGLVEAYNVP